MLAVLLKESWSYVDDRADDLANSFYSRIFLSDPGLRELFPVEMSAQRSRLVEGLVSALQCVDDPDRFEHLLHKLGRSHRRFHVEPHHFGIFGPALIATLREYAGPHWCIEYDQAWRDAFDAIATRMLHGLTQESRLPPSWPAEVVGHERRGRDVAVIRCRPLTPFAFRAGQYVHVECQHHPREWRPYSIANAPRADGTLDLHVRARDGWVSAALVHRSAVGDLVRLGPPVGTMTVDPLSTRDIVGVAGGTGLAAIKALVEEVSGCHHTRWVHLFVGARSREDLYDLPELLHLAGRCPWLSVIPVCSEDPTYGGEVGLVSDAVRRYGPWPDHEFYVCGPPGMVRATLGELSTMDTSRALVHYDALTTY